MRHVFSSSSECLHVFAQQVQDYGSAGNVSFRGNVAYSYGHYPIAEIVDFKKKRVLIQSEKYSMTTAKHISYVWRALSHFDTIYVPALDRQVVDKHNYNIGYFIRLYNTGVDRGKRALKQNTYADAKQALVTAKKYYSWLSSGEKKTLNRESLNFIRRNYHHINKLILDKDAEIDAREKRLSDPAYIAKREEKTERKYRKDIETLFTEIKCVADNPCTDPITPEIRNEELDYYRINWKAYTYKVERFAREHCTRLKAVYENDARRIQAYIDKVTVSREILMEQWHNGEINNDGLNQYFPLYHLPYSIRLLVTLPEQQHNQYALLRFNADRTRIETSQGAQVLVEHAVKIWPVIERSHREQAVYPGNGFKIDYYTVTRIDRGDLVIGCHNIQYGEMERIARELNLIQ